MINSFFWKPLWKSTVRKAKPRRIEITMYNQLYSAISIAGCTGRMTVLNHTILFGSQHPNSTAVRPDLDAFLMGCVAPVCTAAALAAVNIRS
jgi:hypothetical protein